MDVQDGQRSASLRGLLCRTVEPGRLFSVRGRRRADSGVAVGQMRTAPEFPAFIPQRWGVLDVLVVNPAWRRQGIGKRLARAVEAWAIESGAPWVEVNMYNINAEARRFYEALTDSATLDEAADGRHRRGLTRTRWDWLADMRTLLDARRSAMTLTVLPLLAISVAVLAAQEPVFRTGTRLVRLDVSVLDNKKQPVRDLTAADFRVTEGGRALRVRAFQMVEVPTVDDFSGPAVAGATPILGAATVASEDDPTDAIATNPGRLVVLVMDDGMTPTEPRWMRQAKSIARQVIEGMGPRDRVAMQFTRAGRTRLELTSDRPQLLRASRPSTLAAFWPCHPRSRTGRARSLATGARCQRYGTLLRPWPR